MSKEQPKGDSVEELMRVRYKVIADYPLCHYNVGDILPVPDDKIWEEELIYKKYPHLFQPLQWWEERQESEMPEYVKLRTGHVFKCSNWRKENYYLIFNVDGYKRNQRADDYYQPATETEYLNYIKHNSK
jgi:hypothetical protein